MYAPRIIRAVALATIACTASAAGAQTNASKNTTVPVRGKTAVASAPIVLPQGYVIGADDVLDVVFWRDKDMSAEVVVRPDGNISLPLLNDVKAAGYTPEQLRDELVKAASKFVEEPNATVVVKDIKSRNVFITGNVGKPDRYMLTGAMNVMQLIALAGGLHEYADSENIVVMRTVDGKPQQLKFNYKEVLKQKKPQQNVTLQPGDTVVVP